jgi:hypothetical protein
MKNFNGRPFFSLFFIARANQKIPNLALGHRVDFHMLEVVLLCLSIGWYFSPRRAKYAVCQSTPKSKPD